jgi:hypothetical protein
LTELNVNTAALTPTSGSVATAGSFVNQHGAQNAAPLIQGHSGCRIQIKRNNTRLIVEKAAVDTRYSDRLKLQIQKQHRARVENVLPFIRIPEILYEDESSSLYRAEMEYVYFYNSLTFFSSASRPAIDSVANLIFAFIDAEIDSSISLRIPKQLVIDKIESIRASLLNTLAFPRYESLLDWLVKDVTIRPHIELPVGRCHGDLTFSNIMIARDASSLALIDFLDSYLDSPIIDLAKLRQDTLFQWTLLMGEGVEDGVRFTQIMRYLDRQVSNKYRVYDWYNRNIDMLLAVNMLRIAPYAQTSAVHDFLISCLKSLRISNG